jgi:hypothetical protein
MKKGKRRDIAIHIFFSVKKKTRSLKPNLPSPFHPTATSDTKSTPTTASVLFLTADHHLFFVSNRRINAAIFSQISHSWSSVAANRFVEEEELVGITCCRSLFA